MRSSRQFQPLVDWLREADFRDSYENRREIADCLEVWHAALVHISSHTNRVVKGGTDEAATRTAQVIASRALYDLEIPK